VGVGYIATQGGQGGVGNSATQGGQGGVGKSPTEGAAAKPLTANAATNRTNRIELFLIVGNFLSYRMISGDVDLTALRTPKRRKRESVLTHLCDTATLRARV
jgi:hypothetical protein